MLKKLAVWSKWLFGAVLLTAAVVGVTYEDQQARVKYQRDCYEYVRQITALSGQKAASAEDCKNPKHYMPWWDVLVAWPEGITTWAIMFTLGAIVWQAVATQTAARAALRQADHMVASDRPWIFASITGQPQEPLTVRLIKGIIPGIVWEIKVFGNTPARIIREDYRCCIVPPDPSDPLIPMLEPNPTYLKDPKYRGGRIAWPPGEKRSITILVEFKPSATLSDELAQVAIGAMFLCSYGRIEYDALGRIGVTQFCAIYRPPIGGQFKRPDGTILNPPGFSMGGPPGYNYQE